MPCTCSAVASEAAAFHWLRAACVCVCVCQIKVVPGTVKRGKAAKQALDVVVKTCESMTAREKETAKQIRENHLSNAMVGDAKVIIPGADKRKGWARKTVMNWK